jgi:hypothetical protein
MALYRWQRNAEFVKREYGEAIRAPVKVHIISLLNSVYVRQLSARHTGPTATLFRRGPTGLNL